MGTQVRSLINLWGRSRKPDAAASGQRRGHLPGEVDDVGALLEDVARARDAGRLADALRHANRALKVAPSQPEAARGPRRDAVRLAEVKRTPRLGSRGVASAARETPLLASWLDVVRNCPARARRSVLPEGDRSRRRVPGCARQSGVRPSGAGQDRRSDRVLRARTGARQREFRRPHGAWDRISLEAPAGRGGDSPSSRRGLRRRQAHGVGARRDGARPSGPERRGDARFLRSRKRPCRRRPASGALREPCHPPGRRGQAPTKRCTGSSAGSNVTPASMKISRTRMRFSAQGDSTKAGNSTSSDG